MPAISKHGFFQSANVSSEKLETIDATDGNRQNQSTPVHGMSSPYQSPRAVVNDKSEQRNTPKQKVDKIVEEHPKEIVKPKAEVEIKVTGHKMVKEEPKATDDKKDVTPSPGSRSPQYQHSPKTTAFLADLKQESPKSNVSMTNDSDDSIIQNGDRVFLTEAATHFAVYIRSERTAEEYSKLINEVSVAATDKSAPKLTEYPNKNDIVAAPFDDQYYRAMVVNVNEDKGEVKVGFVDYGNTAVVPLKTLRDIPKNLKEHRRLTIRVHLKGLDSELSANESNELKAVLQGYVDTEKLFKLKSDEKEIRAKSEIELIDEIDNKSVNEMLAKKTTKRYKYIDLVAKQVNDTNKELMILSNQLLKSQSLLTCFLYEDRSKFSRLDKMIQDHGRKLNTAPAYRPNKEELCLIKMIENDEESWYRAQFQQELGDNKAQVATIDYIDIMSPSMNDIRAIDSNLTGDMVTFLCRIENIDDYSKDEKKKKFSAYGRIIAKTIQYDADNEIHTIKVE